MKFLSDRMKKIEEEILNIKEKDTDDSVSIGGSAVVRKNIRESRIARLETERNFILDRRNGWKAKSLWNVFVPILITMITAYLLSFKDVYIPQ